MKTTARAIDQWIDELPLEELETAPKFIVKDFREGFTESFTERTYTVAALFKYCSAEIEKWVESNKEIEKSLLCFDS